MLQTLLMIPFCNSSAESRNLVCFFRWALTRAQMIFSQ